jgi:hypothetical protein
LFTSISQIQWPGPARSGACCAFGRGLRSRGRQPIAPMYHLRERFFRYLAGTTKQMYFRIPARATLEDSTWLPTRTLFGNDLGSWRYKRFSFSRITASFLQRAAVLRGAPTKPTPLDLERPLHKCLMLAPSHWRRHRSIGEPSRAIACRLTLSGYKGYDFRSATAS